MGFLKPLLAATVAGMALSQPYVMADDCAADIKDDTLAFACANTFTDTISFAGNSTASWEDVITAGANATSWELVFQGVEFEGKAVGDLLKVMSSAPANSTVTVTLDTCSMDGQQALIMETFPMPAASYSISLSNSTFTTNQVAALAAIGSPATLDMTIDIFGSTIANNQATLGGAIGVEGDAFLNINVDEDSDISNNQLLLGAAVGAGGDGEGVATVNGGNVVGNSVGELLLLTFGGNSSWTANGIEEGSNAVEGKNIVVNEQPLVKTVLGLISTITSSVEGGGGLEGGIGGLLNVIPMLKDQTCAALATVSQQTEDSTVDLDLGSLLPAGLDQLPVLGMDSISSLLGCNNGNSTSNPLLGGLGGLLGGLTGGGNGTDMADLQPILNAILKDPEALGAAVKLLPNLLGGGNSSSSGDDEAEGSKDPLGGLGGLLGGLDLGSLDLGKILGGLGGGDGGLDLGSLDLGKILGGLGGGEGGLDLGGLDLGKILGGLSGGSPPA